MPSAKRERKREGQRSRQEALRAARQRQLRNRRIRNGAIAGVLVAALVAALAIGTSGNDPDDDTDVATEDSTTTSTSAPANLAVAPGAKVTGDTTCPPADGSAPRTTSFEKAPPMCIDVNKTYVARMETDAGNITIALDPKRAPKTVNNFVVLARYHFFDGVAYHRVIPDFVVQGGDPEGTGSGGPGYQFEDELPQAGDYKEGSLAMANSGPNTNGSQFFIVTSANGANALVQAVGGTANYSLFGQVTEGLDVVKKIEADGDPSGTPKVVHKMTKVTIQES